MSTKKPEAPDVVWVTVARDKSGEYLTAGLTAKESLFEVGVSGDAEYSPTEPYVPKAALEAAYGLLAVMHRDGGHYINELAVSLIRWGADALNAMSKVAPDATRFEDLQDRWDEIERRSGHIIRDLLAGREPQENSTLAYAEGVRDGGKQGHAEERDRIVAWLKEEHDNQAYSQRSHRYHYKGAAEDIEEGKHWGMNERKGPF